jgi:L-histidine Nalpha-methyltransferase
MPDSAPSRSAPTFHRAETGIPSLWREVREGLLDSPPTLPPKLFYDARGARLFEEIMRLESYYPTRTEIGILEGHVGEMAGLAGPDVLLLEPGSGSGEKTRLLLDALETPVAYVPVDIAGSQLAAFAEQVRRDHPAVEVLPVVADYTRSFPVPVPTRQPRRSVVFFPGSTVGNLERDVAREFLAHLREEAGIGGGLLMGVDLVKEPSVLEAAYNDPEGVTAEFNRNMLRHLNAILGSDFEPEAFRHHAPWIPEHSRIEMRLVSRRAQRVTFRPPVEGEEEFQLDLGEGDFLVTEHSNKFSLPGLQALTESAGWRTVRTWTDPKEWFAVQFLERAAPG